MIRSLDPEAFLNESIARTVIDVRSPGEFIQGHIPGAANIPLFNDEERAIIGTIYKHAGSETAIRKGTEIATPKIPGYLDALKAVSSRPGILVHCWRGGMRSENMAALFEREGYEPAVLKGGYKAYRRHVRAGFAKPARIAILGGYTGSGKTELLQRIGRLGCQIIDLEGLSCHKGSAFGALGQLPQPTNEQFENDLYDVWRGFDLSRPVWMEDESRMIGRVTLPDPVYEMICNGILLRLDVPRKERSRRLVSEYAGFDKALLSESVSRISERLGRQRTLEALKAIEKGEYEAVADNILIYYDKAYQFSIDRRPRQQKLLFTMPEGPDDRIAGKLIAFVHEIFRNGTHLP